MEPNRSPRREVIAEDLALSIQRAVQKLRRSKRVLAVTGAGMSADSGLPTYRGVGGLYHQDRPTPDGHSIEEVLSGAMFNLRPDVTWTYVREVERACRGATPNRGHEILAEMDGYFDAVWVLTQNVDGLHEAAGSRNVLDIHGDLHLLRCTGCDFRVRVETFEGLSDVPVCPTCGAVIRPDVVLFGETLDESKASTFEHELLKGFDLVFSIGTSSLFDYIVAPIRMAQSAGKSTVEINPEETAISDIVEIKIRAGAATALDEIWNAYLEWWPHT